MPTSGTNKPSVVFFGSGPVAAASLKLLAVHCDIEAIVTKPTTVDEMQAAAPGAPLHPVTNKESLDELISTKPFHSKLAILIDFGIIVSQYVIDYFSLGIINSHFSLLPQWRGADPISFAILSGQPKTGVSLMVLDAGMDTGKLITYRSILLNPDETTPSLTEKLISLSDTLLQEHLAGYIDGSIKPKQQPHPVRATYSRKLTKADGILDWNKSAAQLEREIRAFIEWPKSRCELAGKEVVITQAHTDERSAQPGQIIVDGKQLLIGTSDGCLAIDKLKPAGKPEMTIEAFLAGYRNQLT